MRSLSKKEVEVIAHLEFEERYFFTRDDIRRFFSSKQQLSDFLHGLKEKERILRINRRKYYLVPMKARSGAWSENPFRIADEVCDGKEYVIGGYAAANYWRLTDQVPMQTDVYTTRRQGTVTIMNNRLVFHRTTTRKIQKAVRKELAGHPFLIQDEAETAAWLHR